jgi:predicted RNA-binding protein with TRAM domain
MYPQEISLYSKYRHTRGDPVIIIQGHRKDPRSSHFWGENQSMIEYNSKLFNTNEDTDTGSITNTISTESDSGDDSNSESKVTTDPIMTAEVAHPLAVQELWDRHKILEERVTTNERRAELWREVAATAERVDDVDQAVESVLEILTDLEEQLNSLQCELDSVREDMEREQERQQILESIFSDRVIDRETAHIEAQQRSPSDAVSVGDECTVWIDEIEQEHPAPTAVGRIDGLVTFVEYQTTNPCIEPDQAVEVVITDIQETAAHAKPVTEVTEDE